MAESPPKQRRPNAIPATADALDRGERPGAASPVNDAMRQPNERDEAADHDADGPSPEGKRAANDLAAGREDTDRRSAGTDVKEPQANAAGSARDRGT